MDPGVVNDHHAGQCEGEERGLVPDRHGAAPVIGAVARESRERRRGQQEKLEEVGDNDDGVRQVEARLPRQQVDEPHHEDRRGQAPVPA